MNPHKMECTIFHQNSNNHVVNPSDPSPPQMISSQSPMCLYDDDLSLPEMVLFRASSPDSPYHSSSDNEHPNPRNGASSSQIISPNTNPSESPPPPYISPEPHISSQFYTFNSESHSLMIKCLVELRLATPEEIRAATPRSVLKSWRSVWKDRNEDTAYVTGWKRIQEKLAAHVDTATGNEFLCFKNNSQQFVSHVNQWQDIVTSFHGDADLKHLGLRETIERIKQVWTVGAKFYGIPESYIRVCVGACPVCTSSDGSASRNKRRRFEYTESFDVPAKEVPTRLQQLAAKHKVVLCIRQKYIRYKPFMAEVKDYACHRAGEPAAKKSKMLKREPYASKRCGCGFRIRAIVPIMNYNEKDKSFVYQEEGMAVFKLYAVHSGHEPGPLDGNARIMHRVVGHKGGVLLDQDIVYGVQEDLLDSDVFALMGKEENDLQISLLHQLQELKSEIGFLETRVRKLPTSLLGSVSQQIYELLSKIRCIGEDGSKERCMLSPKNHASDDILVGDNDLAQWADHNDEQMYVNGKDDDDEESFGRTLVEDIVPWDQMHGAEKDLMVDEKAEKWLKCGDFDEKSILECGESKPMMHDDAMIIQVDSFYQDNTKWYDSPCGGEIV